jgi:hypothetical protein
MLRESIKQNEIIGIFGEMGQKRNKTIIVLSGALCPCSLLPGDDWNQWNFEHNRIVSHMNPSENTLFKVVIY